MKSKQQKRAEALKRLERYQRDCISLVPEDGVFDTSADRFGIAARSERIAYLHSIADRKGGRVKRRQVRA